MRTVRGRRSSMMVWPAVIAGCLNAEAGMMLQTPDAAINSSPVNAFETRAHVAQVLPGETVTLPTVGWQAVTEGTVLEPWDMLWVQPGGRVEIEITRDGQVPSRDPETDVRGADGSWTKKKRFRGTFHFIMVPVHYLEAKVNRVIGPVFMATDRERVKAFLALYRSPQGGGGWSSAEEMLEWRKLLREGEDLK